MRKMLSLIVLALFVMSIFSVTTEAVNRKSNKDLRALTDYAITNQKLEKSGTSSVALGAYASDGNSPGEIIGRTWRDDQSHLSPGHYTGWRGNSTPQIHFAYGAQACAGYTNPNACARWHHMNMYEPTTGVFVNGSNGVPLQITPFIEGGAFTQMEVDETGHIIVVGEVMDATLGDEAVNYTKHFWDVSPAGLWGTFLNDTLPFQEVLSTDLYYRQPRVAYQEYMGNYVTHIVNLEDIGFGTTNAQRDLYYFRKVAPSAGPFGTWDAPLLITDSVWSNHHAFGVAQDGSGTVSLVWVGYYGQGGTPPIWVMQSYNAGESWNPKFDIVPEGEEWDAWVECDAMVDSDGYTHVIWPAGGLDPQRTFHWTDRVAGPDAGGTISLVDAIDFDGLSAMCDRFGYNLFSAGKHMLSECNGRIYATWMQVGDPDKGDSTDCADATAAAGVLGRANGDIWMAISSSLDGSLWDARRNLTNSKSPGCDGTDGSPCDHDNYPSPARVGMNTAPSAIGATFWTAVPGAFEVRDALDAAYPDTGHYIDLQYINDIFPGISRYNDDFVWTNNPIKWFRLPCVPPVIEPRIFMPNAFQHPEDWVRAGQEYDLEFEILNLGNAALSVTNIAANYIEGAGWMTINTATMNIDAASTGLLSITLNPGGAINPAPGAPVGIEAWIVLTSDDPNKPVDSVQIRTVIADSVVSVAYEVVSTGHGVSLGALNNGSAGNWPNTGGYMAFEDSLTGLHEDCDNQETVYIYEMSPVLAYDDGTTYFTNGYYAFNDPEPDVNLVPVPTAVESELCSSGGMSQFITGHFVTADSAIGMNKVWGAPDDDVTYIIEKWEIYSFDGGTHTGVSIGEWLDIDVPSDTSVNNFGTAMDADDYIYMQGQETDPASCTDNDRRFYMGGMLGYYNTSELAGDPAVNHTGMSGAHVVLTEDLMTSANEFIPDSIFSFFAKDAFTINNSEAEDQRVFFDFGTFDITPDTLVIWVVHGTLYDKGVADVVAQNAAAKIWYAANRDGFGTCGCCGAFTGGFPGNTNCDIEGKRNLADITKLIDHVYISKADLCCNENGNVNADIEGKRNLADITKLIDHVYISKAPTPLCL